MIKFQWMVLKHLKEIIYAVMVFGLTVSSVWALEGDEIDLEAHTSPTALGLKATPNKPPVAPSEASAIDTQSEGSVQAPEAQLAERNALESPGQEIRLVLLGIKTYRQLHEIKESLMKKLPPENPFFEKKLTRGETVLSIRGKISTEQLRAIVATLQLATATLKVDSSNENSITVRVTQ